MCGETTYIRWSETAGGTKPEKIGADARAERRIFKALTRVTLAKPVDAEEGCVPAGAIGTVVHVWGNGTDCEVEFTKLFHAIAVVKANDIAA